MVINKMKEQVLQNKLSTVEMLVDPSRGVVKNCMDGKRYLVIFRQAFFIPKSDKIFVEHVIRGWF